MCENSKEYEQWRHAFDDKKFVTSFSGGKDSALALYMAMKSGKASGLIVMMEEEGKRSRAHGLTPEVLKAQADAIGLPIYSKAASWESYEEKFIELLKEAKSDGAEVIFTGDIDMPIHGCWYEKVSEKAGLNLGMPLAGMSHNETMDRFIEAGFVTMLVTVNKTMGMTEEDLGRILDAKFIEELVDRGIDPCGEAGEFHTSVIDGPIYKHPVGLKAGSKIHDGDYIYLEVTLSLCPICKKANNCAISLGQEPRSCWCMTSKVPEGLLESIPKEERGINCICSQCVADYKSDNLMKK